ncbi:unnamed protein product [Lymnaea stagnalis]|uniref:THD domain-containing protein n=1 Tax=Lymnaea stagnalis TaxID=6523 RepID=A0AAV2IAZ0_LYMST
MPTCRVGKKKWKCQMWTALILNIVSIGTSSLVIVLLLRKRQYPQPSFEPKSNPTTQLCMRLNRRRCVLHLEFDVTSLYPVRLVFNSSSEDHKEIDTVWAIQDTITNQPTSLHSHSFHTTPVSAHVSFKLPDRLPGTENQPDPNFSNIKQIVMKVDRNNSPNSHDRGVVIQHDGILILFEGLYYIYSGVNFRPNSTLPSSEFPYQTWIHYVLRQSPNSPLNSNVLLRSVLTICPNCTNSQETAYTGGIFYLSEGDIIQGTLSGQGTVQYNKQSSLLGLFMLNGSTGRHSTKDVT